MAGNIRTAQEVVNEIRDHAQAILALTTELQGLAERTTPTAEEISRALTTGGNPHAIQPRH
jgi:hypothetical protein